MKPVPTVIDGKTYRSIRQASLALGVPYNTLWNAIERGDADNINVRPRQPTVYDGATYPTQAAAAEAHGVTQPTISKRLRRRA